MRVGGCGYSLDLRRSDELQEVWEGRSINGAALGWGRKQRGVEMAYRNKCSFIGNVGRDIEIKVFGNGKLGNTSLAVTKKWKDAQGAKQERTTWLNLTVPAHILENAQKFMTKGKQVIVDGELELREYEKDGVKHTAVSVRVVDFQLTGSKPVDNAADASGSDEMEEDPYAGM